MLRDKIKLKISFDEYLQLSWIFADGISRMKNEDRRNRMMILIMAAVNGVHIKMQKNLVVCKENYTLTLSLTEAQAIWLAYEHGYIYAMPGVKYAEIVLQKRCNEIHQLTA